MQEHSDKHRIERAFFQRPAWRNGDLAFLNHTIHPDLLIWCDQDRNLDQPHTSHHIHRSLRESEKQNSESVSRERRETPPFQHAAFCIVNQTALAWSVRPARIMAQGRT